MLFLSIFLQNNSATIMLIAEIKTTCVEEPPSKLSILLLKIRLTISKEMLNTTTKTPLFGLSLEK